MSSCGTRFAWDSLKYALAGVQIILPKKEGNLVALSFLGNVSFEQCKVKVVALAVVRAVLHAKGVNAL